ncbi:MAG: hypothetical protein V2G48_00155 [bacterium JZ-2024 1]
MKKWWQSLKESFYLFRHTRKVPFEVRVLPRDMGSRKRAYLIVIYEFENNKPSHAHPVALIEEKTEAIALSEKIQKEVEKEGVNAFLQRWALERIPPQK